MSSKPAIRREIIDVVKELKKQQRRNSGISRQNFSGVSSANLGSVSSSSSSGSSQTANPPSLKGLLRTSGDVMIGPLSLNTKTQTLAAGSIDISKSTGTGYSSYVIASAAAGTHDLNTIVGAEHDGQLLLLDAPTTVTIKLKHGVDNIVIPDAADYDIIPDSIAILLYDATQTAWVLVSTFARSGAGSGMNNPATANLDMASFGIYNTAVIEGDENEAHLIVSSVSGDVLYNHNGWSHNVPTSHDHRFYINDTEEFRINATASLLNTPLTVTGTFAVTGASSTFGNSSSDSIFFIGRMETDIIPKTTNLHDLGTTSLRFKDAYFSGDVNITDDLIMGNTGSSNITGVNFATVDTLTVNTTAILNGDVTLGNTTADNLVFNGRISGNPDPVNTTIELGQSALRWANIWTQKIDVKGSSSTATAIDINDSGGIIDFDGNAISISATSGVLTLPGNPFGFINAKVGGANVRIPYYNT